MSDLDGCIYDTISCYHTCGGCKYGVNECVKCGCKVYWPDEKLSDNGLCEECELTDE